MELRKIAIFVDDVLSEGGRKLAFAALAMPGPVAISMLPRMDAMRLCLNL
ncbi:MAG: hypothetical protein VX559_13930 [Pseudomonadota bacterium]|nr:hypothetical protein [Pseudomonadota bacterium]